MTFINPTALTRKTTVAICELEVAEVISPNGISVRRRIVTVASAGWANVWAMKVWTQGNHVLVDHTTEEGITTYHHPALAILQQKKKGNGQG